MRKRLLLVLVGVALVLLGGWLTVPKHRINDETIALIKKGMTKQEVETVLGAPPGKYSGPEAAVLYMNIHSGILFCPSFEPEEWEHLTSEEWVGDTSAVRVIFYANGRVHHVNRGVVMPTEVSLLDKVRRWLGL